MATDAGQARTFLRAASLDHGERHGESLACFLYPLIPSAICIGYP